MPEFSAIGFFVRAELPDLRGFSSPMIPRLASLFNARLWSLALAYCLAPSRARAKRVFQQTRLRIHLPQIHLQTRKKTRPRTQNLHLTQHPE